MHLFLNNYVSTVVFILRVLYHLRLLSPIVRIILHTLEIPVRQASLAVHCQGGRKKTTIKSQSSAPVSSMQEKRNTGMLFAAENYWTLNPKAYYESTREFRTQKKNMVNSVTSLKSWVLGMMIKNLMELIGNTSKLLSLLWLTFSG